MAIRGIIVVAAVAGAGLLPATAMATPPSNFRTPSGNIGCDMRADAVRCDILSRSYRAPRKPAACDFDWGGAFSVAKRGRGRFICYSDTVIPPPGARYRVAYGTTVYRNGFSCTVARAGVTCRSPSGHGFFVSRQRYRLF